MNYRHDFNHRKPIAIALLYFAVITLLALALTSCGGSHQPKGSVTETIYVDSIVEIQPRNIHEELDRPLHRVHWTNGQWSTTRGFTPHLGDSTTATTYIYK